MGGRGRPADDHQTTESRARTLRSRLARHAPHLLVRALPRPALHELPRSPGHQRGSRAALARLPHAFARQHGDRLVRPRGGARASRQPRERLDHPPGRRPGDERRHRRAPQRVHPVRHRARPFLTDLDHAGRRGSEAELRAADHRPGRATGHAEARRSEGRRRRSGHDPPGRQGLREPDHRRRKPRAQAGSGATRVDPGHRRRSEAQRSQLDVGRRRRGERRRAAASGCARPVAFRPVRPCVTWRAEPAADMDAIVAVLTRYGYWVIFGTVFAEQIALPLSGVVRIPIRQFLVFTGLGGVLWAGAFVAVGRLFSRQLEIIAESAARFGSWTVALLGAMLGGYIAWKYIERQRFLRKLRIARITPEELKLMLEGGEDVMVVDVRDQIDFDVDPVTIPGALHVTTDELEARHPEIPRDREIILYCT